MNKLINKEYKLIILNTLTDAVYFLDKIYTKNSDLFVLTTCFTINDKFRSYDLECHHISEYYTNEFINEEMNLLSEQVNAALLDLDDKINTNLTALIEKREINIIYTVFRYWLKSDYLGISMIKKAINQIKEDIAIKSVYYFCNSKLNNLEFCISDIIKLDFSPEIEFYEIKNQSTDKSLINDIYKIIYKSVQQPRKILKKINSIFNEYFSFTKIVNSKPTILIAHPLYDLKNFISELTDFNVLFFEHNKMFRIEKNKVNLINVDKATTCDIQKYNLIIEELKKVIKNLCNIDDYHLIGTRRGVTIRTLFNILNERITKLMIPFLSVIDLHKKIDIKLFLWGCPPCAPRSTSLVAEYFLKLGIPVIGSQHGGAYGYQEMGFKHQDTDFSRCSHYFSWGFTKKDTEKPEISYLKDISIYPIGKLTRNTQSINLISKIKKTKIDVLFPLTPAVNILTGPYRIKCSMLNELQNKIFDLLDNQSNMSCFIKPATNYLESGFQLKEKVKNKKKLNVNALKLNDFLDLYQPRLIIIEYPSTPLLEVIGIDCDIFIFDDPVNPITKRARKMLDKRAYVFNDIEMMSYYFTLFKENKLEKRRDKTFYKNYVNNNVSYNANTLIANFINN